MTKAANITRGVVSASMAIMATQAMAAVAKDSDGVIEIKPVEHDLQGRIDAAVAKKDVRNAVAEVFSILASRFGENEQSLAAKYFPGAEGQIAATTSNSRDFTSSAPGCYSNCHSACYSNCHTACHNACHGSRSWR